MPIDGEVLDVPRAQANDALAAIDRLTRRSGPPSND
jgi:hypothetical protein